MCTYAWYFHRDKYVWRFQEVQKGWRGVLPGQTADLSFLSDETLTHPVSRVAIHAAWHPGLYGVPHAPQLLNVEMLQRLLLEGYCRTSGVRPLEECSRENNRIQHSLFQFEGKDWLWDSRCIAAHDLHYQAVRESGFQFNLTVVIQTLSLFTGNLQIEVDEQTRTQMELNTVVREKEKLQAAD